MSSPKISIVIPIYEPSEYLHAALESVRTQTYRDFEIIVSDDTVSSEKAKKIIVDFPALNIKYIQNKTGKGIFNNLNNAIKYSSGEYIQIFCQDDVMLDFFLERQLNLFHEHPSIGLAFSRYLDIDSTGQSMPFLPHMEQAIGTWQTFIPKEKARNYLFVFGCIPGSLSPVMIKREVVNKIGFFEEKYSFGGDYDYWIRTAAEYDFAYNKKVSLHLRTHGERASETLGLFKLIPDAVKLYTVLYKNNSVRVNKFRKYLHINNLVVGNFKGIGKNIIKGKFSFFKLLKYLNSYPFHIPTILLLTFHRSIKRKFTWFITEKDC